MNNNPAARRPIKTRDTSFAKKGAQFLLKSGFSPNAVSVMSVVFSALAAACILAGGSQRSIESWYFWVLGILFIQCRLLCNLFDGMIAVEGGKATANGDLYNEVPDRLSDVILFTAAGYSCLDPVLGSGIGWLCSVASLLTAYIRLHGASLTQNHDFGGPMAKAQRMFFLCVTLAALPLASHSPVDPLLLGLSFIGAGALLTFFLRLRRLSNKLTSKK